MIRLLPLIAASLVPLIVGALWYHPRIFGNAWMSLKHITPDMAERSARRSFMTTIITLCFGFVTAVMMKYLVHAFHITTLLHAAVTACSIWIAFVVPTALHRVLWDHVPMKLFCIETGQWLVSFIGMLIVLSY